MAGTSLGLKLHDVEGGNKPGVEITRSGRWELAGVEITRSGRLELAWDFNHTQWKADTIVGLK